MQSCDTWKGSLRLALIPFVVSRILILSVAFVVHCAGLSVSGADRDWVLRHPLLAPSQSCALSTLKDFLSHGDAAWFRSIAEKGYAAEPFSNTEQKNWAFFPVQPLLLRVLGTFGIDPNIAGIVTSHVLFFAALFLLAELGRTRGMNESARTRALWFLSLFPFSYFLSGSMSEAPFLALSLGTFLALERGAFGYAMIAYSLLVLTRFTGILLLPAIALEAVMNRGALTSRRNPFLLALAGSLPLICFGWFCFHLYQLTGEPFAFYKIQAAWRNGATFSELLHELEAVLLDWNFVTLNALCALLSLGAALVLARSRRYADALICLIPIAAGLSSGTVLSLGRFTAIQFPIFLLLAHKTAHPQVERGLLATSALLLGVLTAGAALHITACLT